ncbi:MAG: hypothetical protein FGM26_08740 [Beijerinckiaceae bacterium]|nr:hypothetical protein [Beijerinckiaceae bacterium]
MKRGRPRATYALPRLWHRLSELNYLANHRGLIRLKNDNFPPDHRFPNGTMLSSREIEKTFNVFSPRLISDRFAADVVAMLNAVRAVRKLDPLNLNDEIVQCAARVIGLQNAYPSRTSEHEDIFSDLATAASYSSEVIRLALDGVILPWKTCEEIVRAAHGLGMTTLTVEAWDVRKGGRLPSNDRGALAEILRRLA